MDCIFKILECIPSFFEKFQFRHLTTSYCKNGEISNCSEILHDDPANFLVVNPFDRFFTQPGKITSKIDI
jgi:hypothetical protein